MKVGDKVQIHDVERAGTSTGTIVEVSGGRHSVYYVVALENSTKQFFKYGEHLNCIYLEGSALTLLTPPTFAQPQPATIEPPLKVVEVTTLPQGSAERKAIPVTSGVLDYFPAALAYVAIISKHGNDKHNPGEPLHWAREKSSDHADCVGRHLLERGTFDSEGFRHSGYMVWRALALLQLELEEAGEVPIARGARV